MIDLITKAEHTGERFSPTCSDLLEIQVNLRRYMAVLPYVAGKRVLDLGCGNGLGTYLYSTVAKSVMGVDYSEDAIAYAKKFPHDRSKMSWRMMDLSQEVPGGEFDICVALEFLEHIEDPDALLYELRERKVGELFFSLPLHSLQSSTWHKYDIRDVKDVVALIDPHCSVERYEALDKRWIVGFGKLRPT